MNSTTAEATLSDNNAVEYARVGLLLALLIMAYSCLRILSGIHNLWETEPAYSHGYVILAIVAYLLWLQRKAIANDRLDPFWPALLPIMGISLLQSTGVQNLEMFLLPSLLASILVLFVGIQASLKYIFPLILLHAALPGWGPAMPVLHKMTVFAVEQMLNITGITAFFDGAAVTIPSGQFIIEDGCSGMNFFIVGTTIAAMYAYLGPRSWRLACISIVMGVLLSILANWVRVYGVILVGHFTEMQSPIVNSHGTFGWFVFAGAMFLFYLLMAKLFPDESFLSGGRSAESATESTQTTPQGSPVRRTSWLTALAVLGLILTLQFGTAANALFTNDNSLNPLVLPVALMSTATAHAWQPQVRGASDITQATINSVQLHVARFDQQASAALVQNDEVWADGKTWRMLAWTTDSLGDHSFQRIDLRSSLNQVLVWTWYGVDDYEGASRTGTRLRQALSRYLGSGTGYLVNLSTLCSTAECADGEAALTQFMQTSGPKLLAEVSQSMYGAKTQESKK